MITFTYHFKFKLHDSYKQVTLCTRLSDLLDDISLEKPLISKFFYFPLITEGSIYNWLPLLQYKNGLDWLYPDMATSKVGVL